MKISVDINGLSALQATIAGQQKQVRFAAAKALTQTAHAINAELKGEMQRKIAGGPTPYTLRAFKVTGANRDRLESSVALRTDSPGKGGVWAKVLSHLFTGGNRAWKRMEGAFRNARILPPGHLMVVARNSWAMPLDGHGNPPPALIVQLISYFRAFGEQGYRANMTDKKRAKLAQRGKTTAGYAAISGIVYFVSYGRAGRPGGDRFTNGRHDQHLAAGIWAKRGTHGSDIAPVFLFVRGGSYRPMFDLDAIGQRTVARDWQRNFDTALSDALRTAR